MDELLQGIQLVFINIKMVMDMVVMMDVVVVMDENCVDSESSGTSMKTLVYN